MTAKQRAKRRPQLLHCYKPDVVYPYYHPWFRWSNARRCEVCADYPCRC